MLIDRINIEEGEKVLAITRRHKFLLIVEALTFIVVALLPAMLLMFMMGNSSFSDIDFVAYQPLIIYGYAVWLLVIWIAAFMAWTDYYLDVLVITNHRLIIANQKGLWRRSLASFRIERLQEVNVEINGFIATMLDFGTLRAETAGHGEEEFHMAYLPDPRALKSKIMEVTDTHPQTFTT